MVESVGRELGKSGVLLGPLGLGGAPIGELYQTLPEDVVEQTLSAAHRLGIRYFDTAPWYGHGLSEHRFGHFLRRQPRESFLLSSKVGRIYRAPDDPTNHSTAPWVGGLPFELRFDYSYDGIWRSYEDSLQRLGLNRVDLLLIHDLDAQYHGTDGVEQRLQELDKGGWRALQELKSTGLIRAIGAGINDQNMMPRFLERYSIDFFLVAMPYTLLDQTPLRETFPRCLEQAVGIVIGAPYASGILATGAVPGAKYGYATASASILDKVGRIERVCERYQVPLPAAALQFPLGNPAVAAVIPGAISPQQVETNVRMMQAPIPAEFWQTLKTENLLDSDAPIPAPI